MIRWVLKVTGIDGDFFNVILHKNPNSRKSVELMHQLFGICCETEGFTYIFYRFISFLYRRGRRLGRTSLFRSGHWRKIIQMFIHSVHIALWETKFIFLFYYIFPINILFCFLRKQNTSHPVNPCSQTNKCWTEQYIKYYVWTWFKKKWYNKLKKMYFEPLFNSYRWNI